jgi:hypothetical protein
MQSFPGRTMRQAKERSRRNDLLACQKAPRRSTWTHCAGLRHFLSCSTIGAMLSLWITGRGRTTAQ